MPGNPEERRARPRGRRARGGPQTFRSPDPLIQVFYEHTRYVLGRSPRTAEEYARDVEAFAAHRTGHLVTDGPFVDLAAASTSDVRRYVLHASADLGYSASAIRRKIAALRSFFGMLVEDGQRADNPAIAVKQPKLPKRLPVVLKHRDVLALIETKLPGRSDFERRRNIAILAVFYASGVRRAELVGMDVDAIDLEERTCRVIGKGNKERGVLLTATARDAVRDYLAVRPRTIDNALFVSGAGKRLSAAFYNKLFRDLRALAGVDDRATPHVLRHSFATQLLEHGVDLFAIKELLGHESLSTTQIYLSASAEHVRKSYDRAHPLDSLSN